MLSSTVGLLSCLIDSKAAAGTDTKTAVGKVYDAQRSIDNLPASLAEALASHLQTYVELVRDSAKELQQEVRLVLRRKLC